MKKLNAQDLFEFLEDKFEKYNQRSFIESDPISIPHLFSKKEDIEISGFLTATIAWGQRKTIIANAQKLIKMMDDAPFDFINNSKAREWNVFKNFTHRTFNGTDCIFFLKSLQNIYKNHKGLENIFSVKNETEIKNSIADFRKVFFSIVHPVRTEKHISKPEKAAAAKRLNMFLRWMVRKDERGVDFGIWKKIAPSQLLCPLDVHTGNTARKLGLLKRKQNDWQAVEELTSALKKFDKNDPVKYDFALFGLGVFEKF